VHGDVEHYDYTFAMRLGQFLSALFGIACLAGFGALLWQASAFALSVFGPIRYLVRNAMSWL
jgi:hypothetical protein